MYTILYAKGKIHNFCELSSLLQTKEHSEAALFEAGYNRYGNSFFDMLNGIFSVVLFNEESNTYVTARDRFGGEPLYYTVSEDHTPTFCDSIKSLLKTGNIKPEFREELLEIYLSYSYIPGEDTAYVNIYKPLPGYVYTFNDGNIIKHPYYTINSQADYGKSKEEHTKELSHCLNEIFENEWQEGALLLSSGVDSNYLLKRLPIKDAYTSCYNEKMFSEAKAAQNICMKNDILHHSVFISPEKYLEVTGDTLEALEQPCGDASAPVLYASCLEIAKKHSCCYSGEGIDEFFMGYYYDDLDDLPQDKTLYEANYIGSTYALDEEDKKQILKNYCGSGKMAYTQEAYDLCCDSDRIRQAAFIDLFVGMNGHLLPNIYCISKATGLNIHTPYIDNRLFDLGLRIPSEYQLTENLTKAIFRKAAGPFIDKKTALNVKRGFPVPVRKWIKQNSFSQKIKAAFLSDTSKKYFNTDKLIDMLDSYINGVGSIDLWRKIWCIYCFIAWYDRMIAPKKSVPHWQVWDEKFNHKIAWNKKEFPYAKLHYMREGGCLVTSLAILLRYYGIEKESREELFNPWILNNKLKAIQAFTYAADLELNAVRDVYPLEFLEKIPYSRKKLIGLLSKNTICLVEVPGVHDPYHFVVPIKATEDDIVIIDSGWDKGFLSEFTCAYNIYTFRIIEKNKLSKVERLREKLVDKAFSYIGLKGKSSNNSVAFLWDIFRLCNMSPAFYDGKKSDDCLQLYEWGVKSGIVVDPEDAERGDIVLFDLDKTEVLIHSGLFLSYMDNGYLRTIEECTDNGRNSYHTVMVKQRSMGEVYAIIRPIWKI